VGRIAIGGERANAYLVTTGRHRGDRAFNPTIDKE
jgi:hypothetical protein